MKIRLAHYDEDDYIGISYHLKQKKNYVEIKHYATESENLAMEFALVFIS